jgi:hypothetical protein
MKFHAPVSGDRPLDLPLVFGHFVPWYTIRGNDFPLPAEERALIAFMPLIEDYRHWNDSRAGYLRTHHHVPAIGLYDSRDPGVIEWQIRTALEYGVSGFIINWYGKYSVENVITIHWLRGLARWNAAHPDRPFHYFFSVDSQAQMASEGKKPVSSEEDFAYIRDHLLTDAYLRRDGRPVFMVFPYEDNAPQWRKALDSVFGAGRADLIWSGSPRGGGENACYAWVRPDDGTIDFNNPYVWNQPDSAGDGFLRRFFRDANAEGSGVEYIMAGVWPGFNDQLVSWAWNPSPDNPNIRPRVICRETTRGNTLELTWKAYLDYLALGRDGETSARIPAPLIQLVTWNDYAETTTLEPTRDYGSAPLEMCRKFLAEARKIFKQL